jgi:exosortase/archaeosortase family protein
LTHNQNKLQAFTVNRIGLKTILGLSLIVASFIIYELFQSTKTEYFFPFAVASFVFGFHFSLSKVKALQSVKQVLTVMAIAVAIILIFVIQGWDKVILDSSYAMMFAKVTTKFVALFLNLFGIHATQNGDSLIFPSDSKIPQVIVTPACSGLESSGVFLAAFVLMLIDLGRKASKKKLATILVLGVASIFFANMLRIAFLGYVAYAFGYDSLSVDHTYSGPIIFLSLIGVFWWLSLRWIVKKPQAAINQKDLV